MGDGRAGDNARGATDLLCMAAQGGKASRGDHVGPCAGGGKTFRLRLRWFEPKIWETPAHQQLVVGKRTPGRKCVRELDLRAIRNSITS
jgi:hypothetical protein